MLTKIMMSQISDRAWNIVEFHPLEQFDQPKYAGILTYLQQRYLVIKTNDGRACTIHWIASAVRLNAGKQRRAGKGRELRRPPRHR